MFGMKVYVVDGKKVWLDKAPECYVEPKKTEEKVELPKAEPKPKAKKVPQNKSRKEVKNK